MSLQDPVSDMLTRIRNAQRASRKTVSVASSKFNANILAVMKREGYLQDYYQDPKAERNLLIKLKYYQGRPVIERIERVSKPSLRIYKSCKTLKQVKGFGVAIISTPKGVVSDKEAKALGLGGEVICEVA